MTAHNPLKNNNGAQASAQANYNYNRKKEEESDVSPRPDTGEPSLEKKEEASKGEPVVVSLPNPSPPRQAEGTSESPLERALENWGEALKKRNQGGCAQ